MSLTLACRTSRTSRVPPTCATSSTERSTARRWAASPRTAWARRRKHVSPRKEGLPSGPAPGGACSLQLDGLQAPLQTPSRCSSPTSVPTGWRRTPATAPSSSTRCARAHLDGPYTPAHPRHTPYTAYAPPNVLTPASCAPSHPFAPPRTPAHTLPLRRFAPPYILYTPLPPYQGSAVTYHLSGRKVRAAPPCAAGGEIPGAKAAPDTPGAATPAAHGACRLACTGLAEAAAPAEGAGRGAHLAGFVRGAAWGSAVVAGLDRMRTPAAAGTRPFRGRCFACGQKGHSKDHCPQWRRADLDDGTGEEQRPIGSASREPQSAEAEPVTSTCSRH